VTPYNLVVPTLSDKRVLSFSDKLPDYAPSHSIRLILIVMAMRTLSLTLLTVVWHHLLVIRLDKDLLHSYTFVIRVSFVFHLNGSK
jgi:hypothetical protein